MVPPGKLQQSDTPRCASGERNKTRGKNKLFHFEALHMSNHKVWLPVASERLWVFNASLPFIHSTGDFIQDGTPPQQFRGLAGNAFERWAVLLKQRAQANCA